MPRAFHASLMKPLAALATPGAYLYGKYHQFRRQQQEQSRRKVTEKELAQLNHKIDKLLAKLDEHEPEMATTQDDECVVCISAKASMQTYPCGHQVVCRKCFVKTIQMAVSQRLLPLRCVICRTKILRLKQQSGSGSTGTSRSFILSHSHSQLSQLSAYSMASSYCSSTTSGGSSSSSTGAASTTSSGTSGGIGVSEVRQYYQQQQHHHHSNRTDSLQRPLLIHDGRASEPKFRLVVSPPPDKQLATSGLLPTSSDASAVAPSPSPSPPPPPQPIAMKSSNAHRRVGDSSAVRPEMMCFVDDDDNDVSFSRRLHRMPSLPKVTLRSRSKRAFKSTMELIRE